MRIARIVTGFNEVPGQVSASIFLTGCSIRCPGCQNPELQNYDSPHSEYPPREVAQKLFLQSRLIDCVVWLGGEPMDHPDILETLKEVRSCLPGLTQCLYTGYPFEKTEGARPYLDIMVTDPWQSRVISDPGTNQRIWLKKNGEWNQITYTEFSQLKG